jgi:hypothetical protein
LTTEQEQGALVTILTCLRQTPYVPDELLPSRMAPLSVRRIVPCRAFLHPSACPMGLYRQQALEERAVALQAHAEVLGGCLATAAPLRFEVPALG